MDRKVILLIVLAGTFAVTPFANGQGYSASVLYPLTTVPSGFSYSTPITEYPQAMMAGQTVGTASGATNNTSHALLWTNTGSEVDLNPTDITGITYSVANGTNGTQQVGYGNGVGTGISGGPTVYWNHALFWAGTAASAVDLNPTALGISSSVAVASSGTQQVGWGAGSETGASTIQHAIVWTGTAASAIDLNPTGLGIIESYAYGTNENQQVGEGATTEGNGVALLWSGTAASAVNLNPTNLSTITESQAIAISGNQQVGQGYNQSGSIQHAMLWTGTAASAVDLNPTDLSGIPISYANGTNGNQQVGWGGPAGRDYALLWTGTAASAVNLHLLLPATGFWDYSYAYTIDSSGVAYGMANGTFDGVTGNFAVEWAPASSWVPGASGSWTNATNWASQTVPSSAVAATFSTGSVTPYAVMLTGNSLANAVTVQGDNVTIQKAGFNLTVPGAVTITGSPSQNASLALSDGSTDTFGSLSITNGKLDITDNTVTIIYGAGNPSPASVIGTYIKSGYNGAAWNGVGIVSSQVASVNAAKGNPHLYAIGYADASDPAVASEHFTPGTVVIEPALVGDANLDGKVNFTDFQLLAANFNGVGTSWDEGNFNYGAKTDFTDFQLLAANFNDSTSLDNADFNSMNQFAKSFGETLLPNADGFGFTFVPEPVAGSLMLVGIAGILLRRRRWAGSL